MTRILPPFAALALCLAAASPVLAQEKGVVGTDELTSALEARRAEEDADRAAIRRVLTTDAAQRVADDLGVDLDRARGASDLLEGDDLEKAGDLSRRLEQELAGGDVLTISSSTLIIVLLLVIIVILIAD